MSNLFDHHRPEPLAVVVERVMRNLRRQKLFERVYALGPRPCFELLLEVTGGADLDHSLAKYAAVDPSTIRALKADQFPPSVHEVA